MNNPALDVIKQIGVHGLCGTGGCHCLRFSLHHIDVDVHCRKSNYGGAGYTIVKVSSPSLEFYDPDKKEQADPRLVDVAREVARQIRDWGSEEVRAVVDLEGTIVPVTA